MQPAEIFERMLRSEFEPSELVNMAPGTPALADDRPVNEYFFLRWWAGERDWVRPG